RVDGNDGRVDGTEGRFDGNDGRVDGTEGRFDGNDGRVDGTDGRVEGNDGRVEGIVGRETDGIPVLGLEGRLKLGLGRLIFGLGRLILEPLLDLPPPPPPPRPRASISAIGINISVPISRKQDAVLFICSCLKKVNFCVRKFWITWPTCSVREGVSPS
ncbi:MAG: hypothetical protein OSA98_20550, partial [Rubripirellula sp.]|nr:hypothetical protein [Rubripirellula sp.]